MGVIMMKNYNWATLGCGVIANELAQAMAAHGRTLYGVANRTHSKAVDFAKNMGSLRSMIRSKTSSVILKSISSIFRPHTTLTSNIYVKLERRANMCSVKNRSH